MKSERSEEVGQGDGMSRSLAGLVSWRASFVLGLITLILGVIITLRPTQSLTAVAALLGVVMLVCGIYHVVRALDGREHERVWRGIAGVLFILTGLVLLRHLHLSVALIGLFIGFTWIIQGITSLMEGFSRARSGAEKSWSVIFGLISLTAGIIVVFAPMGSLATLTVFLGIWFIVMGILEIAGSLAVRRALHNRAAEGVSVPQQREQRADQAATRQDKASRLVRTR